MSLGSYDANELTDQKEVDAYSSSLDVQIAYSCSDCIVDRGKGVEELCDSKDSILETGVKEAMDRGLPSENRGSRESGDDIPEDQQVSSFVEIYLLHSHDRSEVKEEVALLDDVEKDDSTDVVKKVVASLNVVQVPPKSVVEICWGKKGDGAYTGLPVIVCVYVDVNGCVAELPILAFNLDDHISPPLLISYGSGEGRRSVVRCVFDPGGDASPKSAFNSLSCFVVPTLRTRWILTVGELIRSSSTYS